MGDHFKCRLLICWCNWLFCDFIIQTVFVFLGVNMRVLESAIVCCVLLQDGIVQVEIDLIVSGGVASFLINRRDNSIIYTIFLLDKLSE